VTRAGSGNGTSPAEHGCAVSAWSGPQTRARIEAVLCDARISRVLLDGFGQVKGLEALSDSVTATQRAALAARATSAAPPAAAPARLRCAMPTTSRHAPTAAPPRSPTWYCYVGGTTGCGTTVSSG